MNNVAARAVSGVDKYDKAELKSSVTSGAMAAYKDHPEHFESCDTVNDVGSEVTKLLNLAIRHGGELAYVGALKDELDMAKSENAALKEKLDHDAIALDQAKREMQSKAKEAESLKVMADNRGAHLRRLKLAAHDARLIAARLETLRFANPLGRLLIDREPDAELQKAYDRLGFCWEYYANQRCFED